MGMDRQRFQPVKQGNSCLQKAGIVQGWENWQMSRRLLLSGNKFNPSDHDSIIDIELER